MEIIPLGTSSAVPTQERNLSAVAVSLDGAWILLDCGEGTQYRILSAPLKPHRLEAIFITHLHGDHVFGLPGLLSTQSLQARKAPLTVYGPPGLRHFVDSALIATSVYLTYPLAILEHQGGELRDSGRYSVRAGPLNHQIPAYGYRITEFHHRGRPPRQVRAELAYCTDTRPCAAAVELARGVDLLIHEATYSQAMADKADKRGHSTALQAAEIGREAGARKLLLTHFSPRYQDPAILAREAQKVFPDVITARDLVPVAFPPPRRVSRAA